MKQKLSKSVVLNIVLVTVCAALLVLVHAQHKALRGQQQTIHDWEQLSILWREKMDTCMNRNERLWEEINTLTEYKIMKLKEEGKK